jgi:hypothetical protein
MQQMKLILALTNFYNFSGMQEVSDMQPCKNPPQKLLD